MGDWQGRWAFWLVGFSMLSDMVFLFSLAGLYISPIILLPMIPSAPDN